MKRQKAESASIANLLSCLAVFWMLLRRSVKLSSYRVWAVMARRGCKRGSICHWWQERWLPHLRRRSAHLDIRISSLQYILRLDPLAWDHGDDQRVVDRWHRI